MLSVQRAQRPRVGAGPVAGVPVLTCPGYRQETRWQPGERLHQLFEERCDRTPDQVAVDAGDTTVTYRQLDARANQLARHLLAGGVRPGDRVALLFDDARYAYVGMLAVLKAGAAYVPLDAGYPADRLAYIVDDSGAATLLTQAHLAGRLPDVPRVVLVDETAAIGAQSVERLGTAPVDDLCYVIYTSGSTGRPKGVAVEHASICNFVRVAAEVYGLTPHDRVYQGMTIAFDFAVEEIWVPWLAGATLVPKRGAVSLVGEELWEFLDANRVTALCCVPTLLATLEADLPRLRFLLVSGEACPQHLVARWHRPDRRFLNVYGPTEATVTSTWTAVHPERPVTIGVPLPTYSVVILALDGPRALGRGEIGEIGVAGIGLARGYLNRADLTDRAFVPDFVGIANNPSGRIYRTGDLGRINTDGEIEYHGRVDTQVKIRGYRIELSEIESVLLEVPGIAQAVVSTHEPAPGTAELAAYYTTRNGAVDEDGVFAHLRDRLPSYMVPSYLDRLAAIPMLPCDKADRKSLPPPTRRRVPAGRSGYAAPATETERGLADALAGVLDLDQVSVDSHFFDDLAANSLLMAQFCARVRRQDGLPPVAMRDVYLHPTIRELARALGTTHSPQVALDEPPPMRAGTARYRLCGAGQLLVFLAYLYVNATILVEVLWWVTAASGGPATYTRAVVVGVVGFVFLCVVPIAAKWILIGRWQRGEIPLWGATYVRFWCVKTLVRSNPLRLFVGSPLYCWYLRALGARIGPGVTILSHTVPVCTDLLIIGAGTVVNKGASFTCYRAHTGRIQLGRVTIGRDVHVGERGILDIDTSLGDGATLMHASALLPGQSVPAGEVWHGSPAEPASHPRRTIPPARCGVARRVGYAGAQLLLTLLAIPVGLGIAAWLIEHLLGMDEQHFGSLSFWQTALLFSVVLYFGPMLLGLLAVGTLPRLLNLALKPDRVYPLYGLHYALHRTVARVTRAKFYLRLFGDSSYIVGFLQWLGWDLGRVVQTGSNFGTELSYESPYLSSVGSGTMVSDALSMMNVQYSSTSSRLTRVRIGADNFFGNDITFPPDARVGDNCLLATKVLIPSDGPLREGVGLLGSPAFEIPRSVARDSDFDHLKRGDEFRRRLAAKNRHNLVTLALFLLAGWVRFLGVAAISLVFVPHLDSAGALAVIGWSLATLVYGLAYMVLLERLAAGFRPLTPRFCSIYDRYFWWHERLWKMLGAAPFTGTPFKPVMLRLLGVRIGHRVFDDGCDMPEKTLVTIGDDCVLNAGTTIQCHSLEDGTFKSDHTRIGAGCTLGVESFVHYGVTMGDGSVLDADAFLMKGEEVPPGTHWHGNPAHPTP
ncbi:Pls/PosA family non-ribosomal peptide synthetase [Actinomycetes bacterium KLBMP 9797]